MILRKLAIETKTQYNQQLSTLSGGRAETAVICYTSEKSTCLLEQFMSQAIETWPAAFSPEVWSFAAEQGVETYLARVAEFTKQMFLDGAVAVHVESDPEIPTDRHIVFEVDVRLDVSQAMASQREWNDALFECCPAPLSPVFRLSLELVER